jgi:predicted nucleic acid-binding protein
VILVDTSVWIDHLRARSADLAALLTDGLVMTHPFVIGELACGNLNQREQFLKYLRALPAAIPATDKDVSYLVEQRELWGRGIGWIDAHLLASALISGCRFWTMDRRLAQLATAFGIPGRPSA